MYANNTKIYINRLVTFLLLIMFVAVMTDSPAAGRDGARPDSVVWRKWPSRKLLDRSRQLIMADQHVDSAMMYMSEIVNRYYSGETSEEVTNLFLRAMNNIGYLCLYHYYDYQKAFSCYTRSLKIAEETGDNANMAYLYMNLGNLYSTVIVVQNDSHGAREALDCYKKSFFYARKTKDWDAVQIAVANMVDVAYTARLTAYVKKELDSYMKLNFPSGVPLVKYNRLLITGNAALAKKRYAEALSCFVAMEDCIDAKVTPERYLAAAYNHQAETFSLMGEKNKMLGTLEKTG